MSIRIRLRRDTATNWTAANPILGNGEVGLETDTERYKVGDGASLWAALSYFGADSYTDAQARAAVVVDSIADADTDHAPSRNAVFDALALKAPLASPTLTGTPLAPTAAAGTNTTQIATTAYATTADAALRQYPPRAHQPANSYALPFAAVLLSRNTSAINQDVIYVSLGYVAAPIKLNNPQLVCTTGQASAVARVGIATWDIANELTPAASLILDWGTADCSSNGVKTFTNGATFATLSPGTLYAIVFVTGGAASVASFAYYNTWPIGLPGLIQVAAATPNPPLGYSTSTNGATQRANGFNSQPVTAAATLNASVTAFHRNFCVFNTADP